MQGCSIKREKHSGGKLVNFLLFTADAMLMQYNCVHGLEESCVVDLCRFFQYCRNKLSSCQDESTAWQHLFDTSADRDRESGDVSMDLAIQANASVHNENPKTTSSHHRHLEK